MTIWRSGALHASLDGEPPQGDATGRATTGRATTGRAWLAIRFRPRLPAGKWISLRYKTSFFSELARPIVRIRTASQSIDLTMPLPLFGAARWIGYIPADADSVAVLPPGSIEEFALEDCHELGSGLVALQALRQGGRRATSMGLAVAVNTWPLSRYDAWRRAGTRGLDLSGIDRPRSDWSRGVHVRYLCATRGAAAGALLSTCESVRRQVYPHCSLALVSDTAEHPKPPAAGIDRVEPTASWQDLVDRSGRATIFAPIAAGDILPDYAAAAVAEAAARSPDCGLLYADEDEQDAAGRRSKPRLKPDWSPQFQRSTHYVGRAVYLRDGLVGALGMTAGQLADSGFLQTILCRHSGEVGHIRRVLLTRSARSSAMDRPPAPVLGKHGSAIPAVSIVIPTKDKVALLKACLDGIGRITDTELEVVLVDNGSQEEATRHYYRALDADPRIRIVHDPRPFNFARLCNDGAAAARFPVLLFLNNDIQPLDTRWLGALVAWTTDASIGAVGAKLIYPDGRLQHGGLVLGLKGNSGHVEIGSAGDAEGYLDRLVTPHEVSAVTGACLAVERAKFDAVGGFDAEHFPVELNDVDLCLRLGQRGWRTLLAPDCTLIHHESATRGQTRQAAERYPHEHDAFVRRWGPLIGNDPYFHPALASTSTKVALS